MLKMVTRTITALAFIGLLALNVATVTIPAVAQTVASLVGSVVGAGALLPEFRTVNYRGQKKRLADAVSDTSQRIAKRTAKGAARNVGSVLGEAVPVAGIAVVVGATAWELSDACETMKDLQALELATDPHATTDPEVMEVCGMETPTKEEVWSAVKASPAAAWESAKGAMPDLPEMEMPTLDDLAFWRGEEDEPKQSERDQTSPPPSEPPSNVESWQDWTKRKAKDLNPFE